MNWNADTLYIQSGAALVNNGLWNATSDDQMAYNGGSAPSFTNNSSMRKSGGVGSTVINGTVGFVNNGTLQAQTGSIAFTGGSVFNAGSVFSGAGTVAMVSGTNTFNGSFTSANLVLSGGTHLGNAAAVGGTLVFAGGVMAGTWGVAAGQTLSGQSGGFKFIDGMTTVVTNNGTLAWNTTDLLYLRGGATLRNQALFVANQNTSVACNGGSTTVFENTASGTVRAAAGMTLNLNNGAGFVNNGGTLDAAVGAAIRYNGGAVFNAGTKFTGAGSNVAAGNNSFNGSFNSANLVLASGTHAGNAAVVTGTARFTGGSLAGTWQVGSGQTLALGDGGFKYIEGAGTVVTNKGLVAVNTNDFIYLLSGAALANQGTLTFAGSGGVLYNGGAAPSFVNTGLIAKSSAGTTTLGDTLAFNNLGTVDVQAGTLALPTNFTNNGTLKGVGSVTVSGTLTNAGTVAPGASPGTLSLNGNYAQAAGGRFAVELQSLATHDLFNITGTAALGARWR